MMQCYLRVNKLNIVHIYGVLYIYCRVIFFQSSFGDGRVCVISGLDPPKPGYFL